MIVEPICLAIVAAYLAVALRADPRPGRTLRRLGLLVAAAWTAEDSAIRLYGFYTYSPRWTLFVDRVPLLVVVIWPIVIHSAHGLCRRLSTPGRPTLLALATAAMVTLDASLIEPIAVRASLWSWSEPGLLGVPPVGILGWGFFALGAVATLEAIDRRGAPAATETALLVLAPLATHALLLASWWGALRWVNLTVPPWPAVAIAWVASLGIAAWSLAHGWRRRVPLRDLLVRVPAALFFFALLALHGRREPALVAWALAFAPPYLTMMDLGGRRR